MAVIGNSGRYPKIWQNRTVQVNTILFIGLLAVSWVFFGFAFGPRPIDGGDTVQLLASSVFGHYPYCIAQANPINPYRPFVVTPICLSVQLFGPNVLALFSIGVLIFALLAYVWQGVIRNIFGVPAWLGFVIAVLFLAYPDVRLQTYGNCLTRMAGPALVLAGCWLVLHYWDRRGSIGWLILGCLVALSGLLTYDSLFGAWVIGLPLALAYEAKRFSGRWLRVTAATTALTIGYLFWRLVIVPATLTQKNIVAGGSAAPLIFNPLNILRQIGQAYGLIFRLWTLYFPLATGLLSGLRTWLVLAAVVGAVLLAFAFIIRRSHEAFAPSVARSVHIGPRLFAAGLLAIPIMALPYLITSIDAMGSGYITFGTPFGASLFLAALLVTAKQWKPTLARVTLILVGLVVIATLNAGALDGRSIASPVCDFASRFTGQIQRLPPGYFVVVKSDTAPDEWVLSTFMGYLYYDGPTGVDSYDMGHMGYQGYYFIRTPDPVVSAQGIQVNWGELVHTAMLYRFNPVPNIIPLSRGIVVEYQPFEKLTIRHVPDDLKGLLTYPKADTAESSPAQARLQPLCNWG